ncbi:MAG: hypothetical protein ACR2GB_07115, partial [Nocardioidaceae bacterium]
RAFCAPRSSLSTGTVVSQGRRKNRAESQMRMVRGTGARRAHPASAARVGLVRRAARRAIRRALF